MADGKLIITGLGAAGAGGAALLSAIGLAPDNPKAEEASAAPDAEVCLKTPLAFFEGADAGCMGKRRIGEWAGAQVLDNRGAPVELRMSHPEDYLREPEIVRTCKEYNERVDEAWYAGSTREMRREAYFQRACEFLSYIGKAGPAETTHFANGAPTYADLVSLSDGPPFQFGPQEEAERTSDLDISELVDGVWVMASSFQKARLQELAHADFNGDGVGDILAHVAIAVEDATASVGMVGYLEKTAPDGPVRFRQ